jgi:hypothetical protein
VTAPPGSVTTTTTTTSTTLTAAASEKPTLRLHAGARRVAHGGVLQFSVQLSSGAATLRAAQVCADAPTGTALTPAPRRGPKGRECWTVSLRPNTERTFAFSVRVGRHARGTLTATASAALHGLPRLSASARVPVTG